MSGARTTVVAAAGLSLAVAIGVTGCGAAKQVTAKQQVSSALSSFGDAKSAAFTLKLDTTAADVAAISAAEGDSTSASDQRTLTKLIGGDVVLHVQAPAGKTFGDEEKAGTGSQQDLSSLLDDPAALSAALKKQGAFSATVELAGGTLVDVRSLDGVIYLRADVKKILSLAGQNPAELDQLLSSLPPSMASLATAAKGQWVSIDLAQAAQAAKAQGLTKSLATPEPSPSVDPAKVQKLIADLKTAYQQKATITSLGDGAKGTGYRLGAPAKQVAQAVSGDLIALVGPSSAADVNKSIAQIPDKTFTLDLWVKNDKLSDVSLDLTQFLKKPVTGRKLNLDIAVDENGGTVSAPSGATAIDVKALLSQLPAGALTGGGLSGLGGVPGLSSGTAPRGGSAGVGSTKLTKAQIKMLKQSGMTDAQIKELTGGSSSKGA